MDSLRDGTASGRYITRAERDCNLSEETENADVLACRGSSQSLLAHCIVQFFFNETKTKDQVSRFWLWDSHWENPVVDVEKRLPYLPQDQRSRLDPYLNIPPR